MSKQAEDNAGTKDNIDKSANSTFLIKFEESVIDVVDGGINLASDSAIIGEIPIAKWAVAAWKIDGLFYQKRLRRNVAAFLMGIKDSTEEDRQKLLAGELGDVRYQEEFVDTVSLILLEAEKPIKARILGNLTNALIDGAIGFEIYNRLCLIVHSCTVPALHELGHVDKLLTHKRAAAIWMKPR